MEWNKSLLKMESDLVETQYKIGILYAAEGQTNEVEYFNNSMYCTLFPFFSFLFVFFTLFTLRMES